MNSFSNHAYKEIVEAHPYLIQQELLDYCTSKSIHITAYMPFGGDNKRGGSQVLGHPLVVDISQKLGKQPGQVLGSWGIKVCTRTYSETPGVTVETERIFRAAKICKS